MAAAAASLESQSRRDTVVNISLEGSEEKREGSIETDLAVEEDSTRGVCDGTRLTMDQTPPPAYQEHNNFYQSPPSSLQSWCSPPPSYSQIDLSNHQIPSPTPHLGSELGGASSHIPSHLGPGGTTSHLGGARPKRLQQTNQQATIMQRQAGATNGQRIGYEWLQMVTNGERILNVRPKEEEEMNAKGKRGVAIGIFTIVFVVLYLILPYTPFSPWHGSEQQEGGGGTIAILGSF